MWSELAEAIKAIAPAFTAGAACFGAYTAWRGLSRWQDESRGKRRAELAEEVLAGFYRAKDIFREARQPLVINEELRLEEGEDEQLAKHASYAPVRRLRRYREFFSDFRARKYAFSAVFGEQAGEQFDELLKIHNEIFFSVDDLLQYKDWDDEAGKKYLQQRRRIAFKIALGENEEDPIEARLDDAILKVEAICRPAIEAREKKA